MTKLYYDLFSNQSVTFIFIAWFVAVTVVQSPTIIISKSQKHINHILQ